MKFVIQRVKSAKCIVDGKIVGIIKEGLFVLIGFKIGDNDIYFDKSIQKILNLRVFIKYIEIKGNKIPKLMALNIHPQKITK